jgi:hypothetical protein
MAASGTAVPDADIPLNLIISTGCLNCKRIRSVIEECHEILEKPVGVCSDYGNTRSGEPLPKQSYG